jgi:Leucine-rich repeat (LRR) protein
MKHLDRLEILALDFNAGIVGPFPPAVRSMEKLRHLALQWCSFAGTIPNWIGELIQMEYLGLSNNQFTGVVPDGIMKLTNLRLLGLDDNSLDADIELFRNMRGLKSLYVEDNLIRGTISDALMASWPLLQEFDISSNYLDGTLPANFFKHENNLAVIDFHGNDFTGPLPEISKENIDLQFLALYDNRFSGEIPESIALFKSLRHLDLSQNRFETIPEVLGDMTQLTYLFLGTNIYQEGRFPFFLTKLTNLKELSLKSSNLNGQIPEAIHIFRDLQYLDLRKFLPKSIYTRATEIVVFVVLTETHIFHTCFL